MDTKERIKFANIRDHKSMNLSTRKNELEKITKENYRIAKMLKDRQPLINGNKLKESFTKHKKYRTICLRFKPTIEISKSNFSCQLSKIPRKKKSLKGNNKLNTSLRFSKDSIDIKEMYRSAIGTGTFDAFNKCN